MRTPSLFYMLYVLQVIQYPTPPRACRINLSISKHSIHVGRINLGPSQATASKRWSLHSVRVKVRVRVRVGWYLLTSQYTTKLGVRIVTPIWGTEMLPTVDAFIKACAVSTSTTCMVSYGPNISGDVHVKLSVQAVCQPTCNCQGKSITDVQTYFPYSPGIKKPHHMRGTPPFLLSFNLSLFSVIEILQFNQLLIIAVDGTRK